MGKLIIDKKKVNINTLLLAILLISFAVFSPFIYFLTNKNNNGVEAKADTLPPQISKQAINNADCIS